MTLGWSDGGRPALRATNAERDELRRILDNARSEGRLDDAEHTRRSDAVATAKTRRDLAALTTDIPVRRGVRDWTDSARPRSGDRELALRLVNDAVAVGRISATEHARRVKELTAVTSYAALKKLLKGLPGWPSADASRLLAATADRDPVLAELSCAVTDGRIPPAEHEAFEARIRAAPGVADLGRLLAELRARVDDTERAAAIAEIETAHRDGRVDIEERDLRLELAREATVDNQLAGLVGDLRGPARRLSLREREAVAAHLKEALDLGRLDLDEYDARLKTLYAATAFGDVGPLLADLVTPPKPAWRGPLDAAFDALILNSALLPKPRYWWMRWYPKAFWKLATTAILASWAWAIVTMGVVLLGCTVGGGWVPMALLLLTVSKLSQTQKKRVEAAEKRIIAEIEETLRESDKTIEQVVLKLGEGVADVEIEYKRQGRTKVPPKLTEEAVRLIWLSRLYPVKQVKVHVRWESGFELALSGETYDNLRHRHGPRPYGWLPAEGA